MRNRPFALIVILSLFNLMFGGCEAPGSQQAPVSAIDAPEDQTIDAPEPPVIDAPPTGVGPCSEVYSEHEPIPDDCIDCVVGAIPPEGLDPCDEGPYDVAGPVEACGGNALAFGFGGLKCARALALAVFAAIGVTASAIGVATTCTAGQAAVGVGQLACIGTILALIGTSGAYIVSLFDIITDCPWAKARVCGMIRDFLMKMQNAVAALNNFANALPPAVRNMPIANLFVGHPARPAIMRMWPGLTVGQALNAALATMNQQINDMQNKLNNECAGN